MTTFERCLPPTWPRPPHHPVPEPEPDSLDEQVDWLTYSHPELYSMVHSGFGLTGAMAVSATWSRLAAELGDIGDELAKLLFATAQAWEGESAELARDSVSALSDWSSQTGAMAYEVSGCITVQVDNANNARNAMPPPPYPVLQPPKPIPAQSTAFSSGDFGTAKPLFTDSMVYTSEERALHQQAARTMERFQASSRDVYATVPQFAPPDLRRMPFGPPPEQPPIPQPTPPPVPQPPLPPPGPGRLGGGPGGPTGSGGPGGTGGGPAGPGRVTSGPAPLSPGGGVGATPNEPAANRPAAASARPGAPTPAPSGGGMPMGGAGGQRAEDAERKSKRYIDEDVDVWGANDQRVVPPVIGEVNRRA